MSNPGLITALGLAAVCVAPACQSQPEAPPAPLESSPSPQSVEANSAPVDAAGEYDSAWEYIAARYDTDGDGRVTAAEHDRSEQGFARLDHDGDGVLTEADWASRGGGVSMRAMMTQRRAMFAMAMVLQLDDQPMDLPLDEVEAAAVEFDANYDGVLDASEFSAAAANSAGKGLDPAVITGMSRMMVPKDPWAALLDGADADDDQLLSKAELSAFHKDSDDNNDGRWNLTALASSGGGAPGGARDASSGGARKAPRDSLLAQQGELAPDFTLASYDGGEGGDEVTLSDFAGKRPVALIFGSYT